MRKCTSGLMFAVGLLTFAGVSRADLLSGCGTCQGSTYLLQYVTAPVGTYNTTDKHGNTIAGNIYDVFLTIDTTHYNGGGLYLDTVLVKISNTVDVPPSSLVAAPGGTAAWTLYQSGLNAGGCQSVGTDAGALCAQDGHTAPIPGVYKWEFHYATTGSLLLGNLASDIKARYVDGSGNKVGSLVSEGITLQACGGTSGETCGGGGGGGSVPEPFSIALLGTVIASTGVKIRKKLSAA